MALRYLLAPATDRALVRRVLSRVDQILGYPRQHAESEITRTGPRARAIPIASIRTETAFAVLVHDATGAEILHGAIAVQIDGIADALRERFIEHGGVRRRLREWIAAQGWEIRAALPGQADAWAQVAARDGGEGSADGRPIPEGEELSADTKERTR